MADSAVCFVLDKLTILIEEKFQLLQGVEQDVKYVRDELQQMIAFLRVADAMEEIDPEIEVWVKQVRDIANDIEDVIDEFMLHLPPTHYGHGLHGLFCRLCFYLRKLNVRSAIASDIQNIIARVRSVAERHQRYCFKFNIPEQGSSSMSTHNISNDRRGDALLLEEGELVGIDHPKKEIIMQLTEEDPRLKVISVVGTGGLGKTTLVRKVYDDAAVKKHFSIHAWVTVSQFKVEELLKDLIHQLYDKIKQQPPQGMGTMNSNSLKAIVKEFLRQRSYVIVFDDVWSTQAWEAIKNALPNENNGSRIMLSTRLIDVALFSSKENDGYIYHLKPLSKEESWILFRQKTFQGGACPPHLIEISKTILKRCGGLPLAIVAIGGVLATTNLMNIDQWRMFNQSLGSELEGNDKLDSLKRILLLSFNSLPYYLKPCFLFLSIYPEDYLIEHNTLIRLWIMEGFVKEKEGRTLEEVAEGYLNELINRSLIRIVKANDDGTMKRGQIHDLYREIILSRSRVQNFVNTANEQMTKEPKRVRRLSIHGTLADAQITRFSTKLRSLLAFSIEDSQSISGMLQLLSTSGMLKVLDLRGVPLETFPEVVLELYHLRYLSLRGTRVKMLPGSIKKLRNLETLDLKQTYITVLPVEILKLQHLRHLIAYRHVQDPYLPYDSIVGFQALKGIGRLTSLQQLSFIEAYPGTGIFKEIEKMKELRRLMITKLRREQGMAVCSAVNKLQKLSSLGLHSVEEDEILDLGYLSTPPPFLQRLYLRGRLVKMPHWIQSLHSLVKVYFQWSRLSDDPLKYLQDLPNLVHLEFLVGFAGETLCFKAGKFQKLKLLDLDNLEALRWVIIEEGAMPNLEKLIIQRCNLLQRAPLGIEHLTKLQVLEFFDMPHEFNMTLLPDKTGEDYWRVAHIPEVYYTYWREGGWEVNPLEAKLEDENSDQPRAAIRTFGRRNWL